jgi:thiamine biosynthesis lipoprotein
VGTVKRLRISLGTLVAVEATSTSPEAAEAAVEAAFAVLAQLSHRLHPHSADSDLARINNAPLQTRITVHSSTCDLLNLARRLNTLTDGIFDPCLPSRAGRLQDIEVSSGELFCHAPVALDFGGFAKGYAVDCAIETLMRHGCTAGLVNAGGDLRVFGPRAEAIYLRGPAGELAPIELSNAALAVSDADSQRRPAEHEGYYIRGRVPLRNAGAAPGPRPPLRRYAAVIAKEAVIADALTKCVLLCAGPTAGQVLKAFGATQPLDQTQLPGRAQSVYQ